MILNKILTKIRFVGFCFLQLMKASFQHCLKTKKPDENVWLLLVGVAGFEPATSCSQSRRDNRATLHPEGYLYIQEIAERMGLEPMRHLRVDRLAICSVTTPAPLLDFI